MASIVDTPMHIPLNVCVSEGVGSGVRFVPILFLASLTLVKISKQRQTLKHLILKFFEWFLFLDFLAIPIPLTFLV